MHEVKVLQERKDRIRRDVLARRDAMDTAEREHAAAVIRARLATLDVVRTARTLLAFAAVRSEVDLDPLLDERIACGVGVFLPYITQTSPSTLGIARVKDLDADLRPARFGLREPDPGRRRSARLDRIDVVIVPGVAFDRAGGRIGYGGGYYDRLLPLLRPGTPIVAPAFDLQLVAQVPETPLDVRVHTVVTEQRVVTAGAPHASG